MNSQSSDGEGLQVLFCGNRFQIIKKIGKGEFGDIYEGVIQEPEKQRGQQVAIKLERQRKDQISQLLFEAKLYRLLQKGSGIPLFHWFGSEGDFNILVIDLVGPSLEDMFQLCGKHFSYETVIMIEDQIITTIEFMHNNDFLHRDIKPQNFLSNYQQTIEINFYIVGLGKKADQIFTIDFGLAKKFRDPRSGLHIPYIANRSLTGTARYASISTHLGIEQSRRDDLESIGYMLMYFLRGDLPWMNLKANTKKEKYQLIREKKIATPLDVLCKGFPEEFLTFLKYSKSLQFEEKPDYVLIRRIFKDLYYKLQPRWDYIFDWAKKSSDEKERNEDGSLIQESKFKQIKGVN